MSKQIYFKITNDSGKARIFNIGEPNFDKYKGENILELKKESKFVRSLLKIEFDKEEFFKAFGINYPNCWMGIEVLRNDLGLTNYTGKAGDIDLILGNLEDDNLTPNFDLIIGIQIKIAKIFANDDLADFETGTKQAIQTVEYGFDKTYLIHFIIKEPKAPPNNSSPIWNAAINIVSDEHIKRIINKKINVIEKEKFGYVYLAWGQAYNHNWESGGTINFDLVKEAPFRPNRLSKEFEINKKIMVDKLNEMYRNRKNNDLPIIIYDKYNGR